MNATTRVKLEDITPNLTCPLCKGYFIDATTIIECLHSFCKSCIVKHLDKSEYCPVCDVQLHSSKPLSSIRSDYMLQEIVYKLVPGLFQNEMERRRKFYEKNPDAYPANQMDSGQLFNESYITSDDIICLSLERHSKNTDFRDNAKRYIKCQAAVSISVLKKFIQFKFDLSPEAAIEVMYGDRILPDDFLLMDIAYKYSWTQNGKPLQLSYRVSGSPSLFTQAKINLIEEEEEVEVEDQEEVMTKTKSKSLLNGPKCLPLTPSSNNAPPPKPAATPASVKKKASNGTSTSNGDIRKTKSMTTAPNGSSLSPIRGRKKKKVLDTEKELNRIRASVSEAATHQDKEVQLRISENGTISARNVASGEEKIIVGGTKVPASPPVKNNEQLFSTGTSNGMKPRLVMPQEATKFWSANASTPSSIPRPIVEPKTKANKLSTVKSSNGPLLAAKKNGPKNLETSQNTTPVRNERSRPEDVNVAQLLQQGTNNKFSSNMETLKAVTIRLREELSSKMSLFSAEITPIVNGTAAPKLVVKPAEPQNYPAATVHTTDLTKAKNTSYNKRLHQTTIVNGDVKFTKNLLPSPQPKLLPKVSNKDSPKGTAACPPTSSLLGSPTKPPKFFKSRLNTSTIMEPTNLLTTPINGVESPNKHHESSEASSSTSPAAKKPKMADVSSGSPVTVTTSGPTPVVASQSSPRQMLPANMTFNGMPINLMPYMAASYGSLPFLAANTALKNVPMFTHPYFDFSSQIQSIAQGLHNAGGNAAPTLDLTVPNGKTCSSATINQSIAQKQASSPVSKAAAAAASENPPNSSGSDSPEKLHCKIKDSPSQLALQNPSTGFHDLGLIPTPAVTTATMTKVSRKCLSPTKIPRSISNSNKVPNPTPTLASTPVADTGSTPVATEDSTLDTSISGDLPQTKTPESGSATAEKSESEEKCESRQQEVSEAKESPGSSSATDEFTKQVTENNCNNNEENICNNNNVDKESVVDKQQQPPSTSPVRLHEKRSDDSSPSA